ncbi:hypothetical protein AB6A40_002577 [Gnathostoma spinigerum]|uniref:EB domain-containing protein n=1 Tax=Gnathostoma spinigerum TaxID=75299 RepID=A0ABD6EG14_9BILA
MPQPQTLPAPRPIPVISQYCPDGSRPPQGCGPNGLCPQGYGCFQGGCCPLRCPNGQNQAGICIQITTNCAQSGDCCPAAVPHIALPVCPSGQKASSFCTVERGCGPGMECSSGGCCPMPFCPNGVQATGRCLFGSGCRALSMCIDGLCCPLPQCPTGTLAVRVCMSSTECGPGYECVNGGCCPLTPCPNGQIATQRCQGATQCCQGGQVCLNGVCCPLPLCSNGMMATSYCNDNRQCGPGMECAAGGCCPLPTCPSGGQASQRCYPGVGCPPGQFCDGGVCCPIPVCSNGMPSLQLCGIGNSCPLGFVCEGRGCCPEPMPLCPNGGRASRKCVRGSDCAPGFGCTVLGGCCLLSVEPVCPVSQSPVCQCSATNACPAQSTCLSGTCCTSALTAAYNRVPGTQCRSSTQCNGFNAECAACLQTTCVCTNGAASNGATCQQTPPQVLQMARTGCDEYGSPCRYTFSTARRKPIFAPVGNATEKPLWFHVAAKRKCVTDVKKPNYDPDNTCLPNEKCIKGECKMRLWPGEYGCSTDEECSSRCPNTYCSRNSDKNVPQCQCKGGMLLFGRCFVSCPDGFHQSGAYCKHDNEDAFWKDGQAQEKLKEVLNSGTC